MARKLNKNVVGVLMLAGMVLLAVVGVVLIRNLPGQDPAVYAADAKALEEQGEFNRAMQTYARAYRKDDAHNPEYLVSAARCAIEDGDILTARQYIQQARVGNPNLRSAAELATKFELELATRYGGPQQWRRVLDEAKRLADADGETQFVFEAMGQAYLHLRDQDPGYLEKGEEQLKRSWEIDPTRADVVESLAGLLWSKASDAEQSASGKEADAARKQVFAMLASSLEKCEAEKAGEAAARIERLQATYQIMSGSTADGLAALEALAGRESVADTHILLGRIYAGAFGDRVKTDLAKAERDLKAGLEVDPKNAEAYDVLADVYGMQAEQAQSEADAETWLQRKAEVYQKALGEVQTSKHFRMQRDNSYRISFFVELCLQEVDRAARDASEAAKADALAAAESWVEKLKQEVDLESPVVRMLVAHILSARGNVVEAIREAEAAKRTQEGRYNLRLLLLLSDLYAKQRQWGAARDAMEAAVAQRPRMPRLYLRLAQLYLQMNEAARALQYLSPAQPAALRAFMENDEQARRLKVEAYRQLGQVALAERLNQQFSKGTTSDQLREARLMLTDGRYGEAEAKLKAILDAEPENADALVLLVRSYHAGGHDAEAKAFVSSLQEKHPENQDYARLAIALEQDEATRQAKTLEYLEKVPDPFDRAVGLADYYTSREQAEKAVEPLDAAEKLRPDDPGVVARQFRAALQRKDWKRAESYAAKDGALNIDGTKGKIAQGRLALAKGEYDQAIEMMTVGLASYPNYSLGWTFLSEAYRAAGRAAEAKAVLQRALEIDPTNGYANRSLAELSIREGDEQAAKKYLLAAARSLPDDAWVRRRLQILNEKENPKEGIALREKNRQENPDDVENLVLLARLYGQPEVAEFEKAAEAYEHALQVSKDDIALAREVAGFYGREDVNRPNQGESLLLRLLKDDQDKAKKALVAVYLGQFYESQKVSATADRYFRLAVSLDPSTDVLTYAAEFYTRINRLRDALEYYERVRQTAKDNPELVTTVRLRSIGILLTLGEMDQAKEQIDSFVHDRPDDPQGMVYEGAYHRMGGDVQKAKEAFDAHLAKNPDNAMALWQRGQLYILTGRYAPAIADLTKAKTFSPHGFGYQHRIALADALASAGRASEAIAELREVLNEQPDAAHVVQALVDTYLRVNPPQYENAETLVRSYMRQNPKDVRWPRLLGLLGEKAGDWGKAAEGYEKLAELTHNSPEAITALFGVYRKAGRAGDIVQWETTKVSSAALQAAPAALSAVGWAYHQAGNQERCLAAYERALAATGENFPGYAQVVSDMANVLGRETTLARAQAMAAEDPSNVDKKKALVHLLQMNGRSEEAMRVCEEIGKLATRPGDTVFAEAGQGMLSEVQGRYEEAKARYEAALQADPNNRMTLNNLAYLLVDKLDRPAEALPYAEQAKRLAPDDASVLDTLGYVLSRLQRSGEAAGVLLRALEISRDSIAINYHLGVVCGMRNEREDALIRLRRAKELAEAQGETRYLPKINKALEEYEGAEKSPGR